MIFKYNKDLYSKDSLIKAAYKFIDDFYLHLDCDEKYYYVDIESKEGKLIDEKSFNNELLIQQTRSIVQERTGKLREMMYARALASTVIEKVDDYYSDEDYNENEILVDWFDEYEE